MAEEEKQGSGLNRRNFLKSAGAVVAGGAAMGAGLTITTESAAAAEAAVPTTLTSFRCPIDAKDFSSFEALRKHFAEAHPGRVIPVTTKLKVNGKDYEVLIESSLDLRTPSSNLTDRAKQMRPASAAPARS